MSRPRWLLLLPIILISSTSFAATIDVLVVFSDDVALSTLEKSDVAGRYQQALSAVYDDQLEGDRRVEVSVLFTEMSYRGYGKSLLEGVNWLANQNNILTSPLRTVRDAWGSDGADLILKILS